MRMTSDAAGPVVSRPESDALFDAVRTWGRWEQAGRGAWNRVTAEVRARQPRTRPAPHDRPRRPLALAVAATVAVGRRTFMLVVAPLNIPGGTGSPLTPVAVL